MTQQDKKEKVEYDEDATRAVIEQYEDDHGFVHGYIARLVDPYFPTAALKVYKYSDQTEVTAEHILEYLIDNSTDWEY